MATSTPSCGVCDLRHITKPSILWCTECDEGLCTECQEHHSLSKASRNHKVVPINEYHKLPTDVLKITQYCSKHDEKFQIYCQKHECPCCSKCVVESHKVCQDIVNLDDVIQNAKTSNALSEIEETLVEVTENLQKIRHHQQNNQSTLKEKRKEIEKEIKKTRMKINSHLDKLQEDLMKHLYGLEEKENSKICQLLSSLEKNQKEIAECQTNIGNIKTHATDLQMLLSMRQIEKDVYSKEKFLQSLVEGEKLKQNSLSFKINASIQNIMSDIISFGEVRMESYSCNIRLIQKKVKQAQMMVPTVQSRSIDNIEITLHKTINTQGESVHGCCILPDGQLAFTYEDDQKVKVFKDKGSTNFKVKIPHNPFDVVYNSEDNTLAVTSGNSEKQCITIIDMKRKLIKKNISLDSNSYGIALKDNQLIYSGHNKGIRMINVYDESIRDVVREEISRESYVVTFRNNIYITDQFEHTVKCYNLKGEIQWKFGRSPLLDFPTGIDVDNDGNVYVVGLTSNTAVIISPDGLQGRLILCARHGLDQPTSLRFSPSKNQFLITNYMDCKALLFNVV